MLRASARLWRVWCLAGMLQLAGVSLASAHAGSVAFWRVVLHADGARSEILVALDDASRATPGVLTGAGDVPVERLGSFGDDLLRHFEVLDQRAPAPARILGARVLSSGLLEVRVEHRLRRGAHALALRATFHELTDDSHRVIARVERPGGVDALVFTVATPRHDLPETDRATWRDTVAPTGSLRAMLLLGVEHILTGYDHLVFLACLLVPGGTWRSRVAIVSAFTAAHSLTLVLAAARVVTPPAQFVEVAIAFSIAYVALENLLAGPTAAEGPSRGAARARWPVAFGFGLIHGFGFAGMLDVLDLPVGDWLAAVLAFNLGVEIGQLAVVVVALPVVFAIARSAWHRRFVQCTSVLVLGLSLVWFVQRLP